jgi:hypothetical protein
MAPVTKKLTMGMMPNRLHTYAITALAAMSATTSERNAGAAAMERKGAMSGDGNLGQAVNVYRP